MNADSPNDTPGEPPNADDPVGGLPLFDRHLRIESLAERLHDLAAVYERGTFTTRPDVTDGIVLPLLRHLGWDTADSDVAAPNYTTSAGAVDFALCHPPGDPQILIRLGALP